ncbi:MAG: OmpA family protein [Phycisphaerae bacterium]
MRRVSAAVGFVLMGVMTLVAIGCVPQEKYDALLLLNRELQKEIYDKEAEIARLGERTGALQARALDAQRLLEQKDEHLASVMKERDEVRKAFDELMEVYKKLAERPAGEAALPEQIAIEIEQLAAQYPDLFEFDRASGRLRFASDITFDSGSNVVKPGARTAITKLARILASDVARQVHATIIGHTDSDRVAKPATISLLKELGKSANNQGLSEARAEAVAALLKAGGVEDTRIITRGMGAGQPIAGNNTADGKTKNRRVEIFLTMGA